MRIYSQYVGMEIVIEKCTMLVMKSGKRHTMEGVEVPNQVIIRTLGHEDQQNNFIAGTLLKV